MIAIRSRASGLFRTGQALFAQNRVQEAISTLTEALHLRPRSPGRHLHLALALAEAQQFEAARQLIQQAIDLQPCNPVLPMFMGQIALDAGDVLEARVWCERALQLNPHNCHTLGLLALLDLLQEQPQQGVQRLLQPVPLPLPPLERAALWLCRSRVPSLIQQANSALQSRLLLHLETLLMASTEKARTLTQQLLAQEQRDNPVLLWLDRCLTRSVMGLRRGFVYGAQQAQRLLALQAEEAAYLGERTRAIQLYQRLLQHQDTAPVHHALWQLHFEQGEFREALQHLRPLVQLSDAVPVDTSLALALGELLYHTAQYDDAEVALQRATEAPLSDYKPWYYLGLCALRKAQPQNARQHFARAVRLLHPDIVTLRLQEWCRVAHVPTL